MLKQQTLKRHHNFSDYSKYYKNEEKILTFGNSKATNKGVK